MRQVSNRALLCPFAKKKSDKIASTIDWTGESGWMLSAHAICWVSWANSSHTEYVFINPESILNFNKLTCSSRLEELCFPTGFFLHYPRLMLDPAGPGGSFAWSAYCVMAPWDPFDRRETQGMDRGIPLASFWRPWKLRPWDLGQIDVWSMNIRRNKHASFMKF